MDLQRFRRFDGIGRMARQTTGGSRADVQDGMVIRKPRIVKSKLVARFFGLLLCLGLFFTWDWMPFRTLQRDMVGWCVHAHHPTPFTYMGSPAIAVNGKVHYYSANCTYALVVLIVAPFVWSIGSGIHKNVLRIVGTAAAVLVANVFRCWAAVYLNIHGVERVYAHDLPNYVIVFCILAIVIGLAIRRDCSATS